MCFTPYLNLIGSPNVFRKRNHTGAVPSPSGKNGLISPNRQFNLFSVKVQYTTGGKELKEAAVTLLKQSLNHLSITVRPAVTKPATCPTAGLKRSLMFPLDGTALKVSSFSSIHFYSSVPPSLPCPCIPSLLCDDSIPVVCSLPLYKSLHRLLPSPPSSRSVMKSSSGINSHCRHLCDLITRDCRGNCLNQFHNHPSITTPSLFLDNSGSSKQLRGQLSKQVAS